MKMVLWVLAVACVLLGGCGGFRFAAGEDQKRNAYVHERTTAVAAETARVEEASAKLQSLTELSELQSRAFVIDYGLPEQVPAVGTAEQILAEGNWQTARNAAVEASRKPTGWDVADAVLQAAIGISALAGGVYGTKMVGFLQAARIKSEALKEIIEGNELFKRQNAEQAQMFKDAQAGQSPATRKIVSEMKSG